MGWFIANEYLLTSCAMSTHRGGRGVEPLVAEGCNQSLTQAAVKVKGLLSMHVYTHPCPSMSIYLCWCLYVCRLRYKACLLSTMDSDMVNYLPSVVYMYIAAWLCCLIKPRQLHNMCDKYASLMCRLIDRPPQLYCSSDPLEVAAEIVSLAWMWTLHLHFRNGHSFAPKRVVTL